MHLKDFLIRFCIFSVFTAALVLLQYFVPVLTGYVFFGGVTWGLFVLLILYMYFSGQSALLNSDKHKFDRLLIGFNALKIVSAVVFIIVYHSYYSPPDNWFLIPFFSIYVLFTIFEVDMLSKMAKNEPKPERP